MIPGLIGAFLLACFIWWRRAKKGRAEPGPLAGYDTGVRSAYLTPAKRFHNRRTL